MNDLEALVHVSSAFVHSNRQFVKEKVYKPPMSADRLVKCTEWISNDLADQITPWTIGKRSDTCTYTKAIAESLLKKECAKHVPCVIVRPTMLGATWTGPFPGWLDNIDVPIDFFKNIKQGSNCAAEIIPVDLTVNLMITAAWERATQKTKSTKIRVYNNTSSAKNKITWEAIKKICREAFWKHPIDNMFLVPNTIINPNVLLFTGSHKNSLFDELIPAYVTDCLCYFNSKKQKYIIIKLLKLNLLYMLTLFISFRTDPKSINQADYFSSHEWKFMNMRITRLETQMNSTDQKV